MQDKDSTPRAAGETELPMPPEDHDRWNEYHEAFGIVVRQAAAGYRGRWSKEKRRLQE